MSSREARSEYYVTSGGKRVAAASGNLPESAAQCAAAKKLPKPEAPASSCTGQRFTVVVAHAGGASGWRCCTPRMAAAGDIAHPEPFKEPARLAERFA